MNHYICIHAHFYQPPRENPWLEEVELQDAAYPHHDWNSRITAECYAPNASSRILDSDRKIIDIVNNYSRISFNFGPTLLSWMERHKPEIYQKILEADRESQKNFSGHGSALAQCYNHLIMPLANHKDKLTQIIWGIRDFEYRFKRKPEGMWLPETGVDYEILEILAEREIKFTILAPHQVRRIRKIGDNSWQEVNSKGIDPRQPYLCRLPSGKSIVLFFYDGPISRHIAFGDLLQSGKNFAERLVSAFSENKERNELVHIATDGETYGHHHRFGDMALAYCLYRIETNKLARITIYGEYLGKYPPEFEAEILENTSWSCVHGVERWKSNCGCSTGMHPKWTQTWRALLRSAMDWLRDNLSNIYVKQTSAYLKDPWEAREAYIDVILDRSSASVKRFFSHNALRKLSPEENVKVLKLLEMQRQSMLMYTSCGWFFDEISGIETTQIMQYAARAIQLARETSDISLEESFINLLERAPSNIPDLKNGSWIYEKSVKPLILDLSRVGAHLAVSSLFKDYSDNMKIFSYAADIQSFEREESGRLKLAMGRVTVRSDITWEEKKLYFAVIYLGDHNIIGGVDEFKDMESFSLMHHEIKNAFGKTDFSEVIRLIDKHFSGLSYSLWHLFKDEQREILNIVLESTLMDIESSFRQIYERYYPLSQVMTEFRIPLPRSLTSAAGFVLGLEIHRLLESQKIDLGKLQKLTEEVKKGQFELDKNILSFIATQKITSYMQAFSENFEDLSRFTYLSELLETLEKLNLDLNLWETQNIYFFLGKKVISAMREKAEKGEAKAKRWLELFMELGENLKVRIE